MFGEVDLATVDQLEAQLHQLIGEGVCIVLDLTATDFMDSTGLRLMVSTHNRLAELGGRLIVAVGGGPISRLLDATGLRDTLDVTDSVEDALGA